MAPERNVGRGFSGGVETWEAGLTPLFPTKDATTEPPKVGDLPAPPGGNAFAVQLPAS